MLRTFFGHRAGCLLASASGRLAFRKPDGERGAVLVVASIAAVLAISAAAMAVDLGRAVSTKRTLQSLVDVASLDAVRAVGDRFGQGGGLSAQQHAEKLAQESLQRNGFDPTNAAAGNSHTVELGEFDPDTKVFTVTADSTAWNAVRLSATTSKGWTFVPGVKEFAATAVASVSDKAAISIGSYLARIDTSVGLLNSVFGSFLGGSVTLVGYTGIAAGRVNLNELKTEFGFGTVDELLAADVSVKDLLNATANALQKRGDTASLTAATDVFTLASTTNSALRLELGDLINIAQGSGSAAATTDLNVLQLIQMAAQIANGTNAVSVSLSTASLGSLGSLLNPGGNTVTLKVIEPPQIGIGPARQDANGDWVTWAQTGQIRAQVHLRPLATVLGTPLDLPIYVEGAAARAELRGIDCNNPLDSSAVTVHTTSQAVRARVGVASDINASGTVTVNDATILNAVGLVKVTGKADLSLLSSASSPDLVFNGPFDWTQLKSVGTGTSLGVGTGIKAKPIDYKAIALGFNALGLPLVDLDGVVSDVIAVINPILDVLDAGLTDPLLANLGLSLGGGDTSVGPLTCGARTLVS